MSENDFNQLDTQFEDVITHLNAARPVVPATPASFKAELRSTLRDQVAILSKPDQKPSLRLVPYSLALTLVFVIVSIIFTQQRPVSAAEIVSRASIAATNTAAFGLNSYSGVRLNWMNDSYCEQCVNSKDALQLRWQDRIWFQTPTLWRREMYSYTGWNPAILATEPIIEDEQGRMFASATILNDGLIVWWHHIIGKTVEQRSPEITFISGLIPNSTDFNAMLKTFQNENSNVTLLGTETIAGRETYVLSFTPKPDVAVWPQTAQIKAWIDKETYIQLGLEQIAKSGVTLNKWYYIKFDVNPELSPDLFTFKVPDDVRKVIDLRTPHDEAELAFAWRVVALIADYKIFRPVNIPSKFIMERPHYINGGNFINMPSEQHFYLKGEEAPAFIFIQQGEANWGMDGEPVTIGSNTGEYIEEYGRRILTFSREGTEIVLQTTQRAMTKEELFHIAETLELVPKF